MIDTVDENLDHADQNIFHLASLICACILLMVAVFGIIGNLLTLLVFIKPTSMSSINVLLAGQAVMDIILLVTATPLFATMGIVAYHYTDYGVYVISIFVSYIYPIAMFAQSSTVWIAVVITCERYLAVCRPFKALTVCRPKNAKLALLLINMFSAAYNLCRFWEYRVNDAHNLEPILKAEYFYIEFYYHWLYFLTSFLIPIIVMVILNAFIVRTLFTSKRLRPKTTRQENREHKTSMMVLVITFTFLVCNFLAFILNGTDSACLYSGNLPDYCDEAYYEFLIDLNNVLVEINSSVPFLIYVLFSRCFRIRLNKLMEKIKLKWISLMTFSRMSDRNRNTRLCSSLCKDKSETFMLQVL